MMQAASSTRMLSYSLSEENSWTRIAEIIGREDIGGESTFFNSWKLSCLEGKQKKFWQESKHKKTAANIHKRADNRRQKSNWTGHSHIICISSTNARSSILPGRINLKTFWFQTWHDFMNSYTVELIHSDRCSLHVWWELYLQCERELRRCILVARPFSEFSCSTFTLFPRNFVTSLFHHLTPSSFYIVLSLSLLWLSPCHALQFIITLTSLHNQLV